MFRFNQILILALAVGLTFASIERGYAAKGATEEVLQAEQTMDPEVTKKAGEELTNYTWLLVKMLGVLLLVCALAVFTLRTLLPRFGGFRKGGQQVVSILERYPLEPKKSLYLIKVGANHHLLGVSEHNVSYLMPVDPATGAAYQEGLKAEEGLRMHRSFQDILQGLKGKKV